MKKIVFFAAFAALLTSCADNKTFTKSDDTEFVASPYGWMNKEKAIDGVEYELCGSNLVISIVLGETVFAPILITGLELYEPVSYNEPR